MMIIKKAKEIMHYSNLWKNDNDQSDYAEDRGDDFDSENNDDDDNVDDDSDYDIDNDNHDNDSTLHVIYCIVFRLLLSELLNNSMAWMKITCFTYSFKKWGNLLINLEPSMILHSFFH